MELSLAEQEALAAYLEVSRMEFYFALSLTKTDPVQRERYSEALDKAIDLLDLKRDAVDEDRQAVLELTTFLEKGEHRC